MISLLLCDQYYLKLFKSLKCNVQFWSSKREIMTTNWLIMESNWFWFQNMHHHHLHHCIIILRIDNRIIEHFLLAIKISINVKAQLPVIKNTVPLSNLIHPTQDYSIHVPLMQEKEWNRWNTFKIMLDHICKTDDHDIRGLRLRVANYRAMPCIVMQTC